MAKLSLYAARPALVAAGVAVVVLSLDHLLPRGIGVPFLYVVVVIAALWSPRERFALAAALGITALVAGDLLLSPHASAGWLLTINHQLAVVAVWTTALLVYRHKLIERSLLREEEAAQAYLDIAAVVILVVDPAGRTTLINRRGCELLGVEAEEILGRPWIDRFVPERERERVRAELERIVQGGHPVVGFENPVLTASGEERLVSWRATVIREGDGRVRVVVASGEDITERRNTERRLRAQESLAKLGQLAAIVAHEVRNPLAGIRGAIQILSRRMADGEDRRVMDRIVERVDTLNALTEDLLVYARPHTPVLAAVRLKRVLGAACRLLAGHADLAAVRIEVDADDAVLEADEKMLQDVFLNLFLNSAQAMKGEGAIRVEVRVGSDTVRVDVADDGPGIPLDVRDRAFEPFFTTRHRGTGLGLPIVKRDVEAHGGEVTLTFPDKGGTRVSVTLPLSQGSRTLAGSAGPDTTAQTAS